MDCETDRTASSLLKGVRQFVNPLGFDPQVTAPMEYPDRHLYLYLSYRFTKHILIRLVLSFGQCYLHDSVIVQLTPC